MPAKQLDVSTVPIEMEEETDEYVVERIVRAEGTGSERRYLIKWLGA